MYRKIILLLISTFLISCDTVPDDWNWGIRPRPAVGSTGLPSTESDYGKGFKNGCEFAWNQHGRGMLEHLSVTIDYDSISNRHPDYMDGWWDAQEQCTYILDNDTI